MALVTRRFQLTAQQFIDDPELYARVEKLVRSANWLPLFGELPVGAVLSQVAPPDDPESGIVFHFKVER